MDINSASTLLRHLWPWLGPPNRRGHQARGLGPWWLQQLIGAAGIVEGSDLRLRGEGTSREAIWKRKSNSPTFTMVQHGPTVQHGWSTH